MELLPAVTAAMMGNVDVSAQVILQLTGDFERRTVTYQCEEIADPLQVVFIDAKPNFLAIMPVGPYTMVFVNVSAASGAKYVGGEFEFWTKGAEATLTDLEADAGSSVACTEMTETP